MKIKSIFLLSIMAFTIITFVEFSHGKTQIKNSPTAALKLLDNNKFEIY